MIQNEIKNPLAELSQRILDSSNGLFVCRCPEILRILRISCAYGVCKSDV